MSLLWRLPSLFDPPWVNDEGTYFAVASAMAHGLRLYDGVWENKPPALYLVFGAVYHPFGPSLLGVRIIAGLVVLVLVALTFLLAREWLGSARATSIALLTGLLFGVPFLEGTTANAEVFVAACTAAAVFLGVRRGYALPAGLLLGLAILFKVVAAFDALAVALWLLRTCPRKLFPLAVGSILVLAACLVWAWSAGFARGMIENAVLYDIGYVGHANGGAVPWLLGLKVLLLAAATAIAWGKPFPVLWLVYALFGALFSGRLFGHYLLQPVVPLALCIGLLLPVRKRVLDRLPYLVVALFVALGALAGVVGWSLSSSGHDSIFARRLQYYPNVVRLAIGQESYRTFSDEIDDHVLRNQAVARAITHEPPGRLLVWGNTPWVYVLSNRLPATRYTSALRSPEVPDETETLRAAVRRAGPRTVVVIRPPLPPLGNAQGALRASYRLVKAIGDARIYVRSATR